MDHHDNQVKVQVALDSTPHAVSVFEVPRVGIFLHTPADSLTSSSCFLTLDYSSLLAPKLASQMLFETITALLQGWRRIRS